MTNRQSTFTQHFLLYIIIKFPYNVHFDWLKQRALSENKVQVDSNFCFKIVTNLTKLKIPSA